MIHTRIAPSPTGPFHIGNARTALFNFLFTKKQGGEIYLRIEDTDKERSKKEYEDNIILSLEWLGIKWDGEIIRQSERTEKYQSYLEKMIAGGRAFFCGHSQEELEQEQKEQEAQKLPLRHTCEHAYQQLDAGIVRLKNPGGKITFNDIIRGEVSFEAELLGDIVLAKNLNTPLYNFAVVVDDHEMNITHVIRGEDHISNTPKQILIQKALGFDQPQYAHVPLILGSDRSKLSKRHGASSTGSTNSPQASSGQAASVSEYREQGYLPEAVVNFLALLGWHPQNNQEIFSMEELIEEFDLNRVQKGGAIFDINKLDSINQHYIKNLPVGDLSGLLKPHLVNFNLTTDQLSKLAKHFQERLKKLSDIKELTSYIFKLPDYETRLLCWKDTSPQMTLDYLELIKQKLEGLAESQFDIDCLTTELMPLANEKGRGEVLWPLRVALSGLDKSLGPFEMIEILGKKETTIRLNAAIDKLNTVI
ncbi:MAG: glutamate--tRNA ligase [Patescibacteria group bacterium]